MFDPDVLELLVFPTLYVMHVEELIEELTISLTRNQVLKIDFRSLMLLEGVPIEAFSP